MPYSLLISYTSDSYIQLGWTDYSLGEKGFIIERSDYSKNQFTVIDTTLENVTSYTDSFNIQLGVRYYYRVRAFKSQNKSEYTNTAEAIALLDAPTDLRFNPIGKYDSAPYISWAGHCNFQKKFIIQSRVVGESSDFKTIAETDAEKQWFPLNDLDENKVYEFRVIAATERNVSEASNTLTVLYGCMQESIQTYSSSGYGSQIDFSPISNNFAVTCLDYHSSPFTVYNADLQKTVFSLVGFYSGTLKYSPSGQVIALARAEYAGTTPDYIYFIDAIKGNITDFIQITARSLDFSSDGSKLAVGAPASLYGRPSVVGMVDVASHKKIWTKDNYPIAKVKLTPDGNKLIAVQKGTSNNIIIFNAADGSVIKLLSDENRDIVDCCLSDDGRLLAFSTGDYSGGNIHIYDMSTLTEVRTFNANATSIAFTHDSKYLAAGRNGVRIFRVKDWLDMGEVAQTLQDSYGIRSLSFNHTNNMLAAGRESYPAVIKLSLGWRSR
ncbi:MAG: eIF2A-related protein [archaeon]